MKKTRTIAVSEDLYAELKRRAGEAGLSITGLIRLLVEACSAEKLDEDTLAVVRRTEGGERVTVLRLIPQTRISMLNREITRLKRRVRELEEEREEQMTRIRRLIEMLAEPCRGGEP